MVLFRWVLLPPRCVHHPALLRRPGTPICLSPHPVPCLPTACRTRRRHTGEHLTTTTATTATATAGSVGHSVPSSPTPLTDDGLTPPSCCLRRSLWRSTVPHQVDPVPRTFPFPTTLHHPPNPTTLPRRSPTHNTHNTRTHNTHTHTHLTHSTHTCTTTHTAGPLWTVLAGTLQRHPRSTLLTRVWVLPPSPPPVRADTPRISHTHMRVESSALVTQCLGLDQRMAPGVQLTATPTCHTRLLQMAAWV